MSHFDGGSNFTLGERENASGCGVGMRAAHLEEGNTPRHPVSATRTQDNNPRALQATGDPRTPAAETTLCGPWNGAPARNGSGSMAPDLSHICPHPLNLISENILQTASIGGLHFMESLSLFAKYLDRGVIHGACCSPI